MIADARLPLPNARFWVPENARGIYRLDLAYPNERVAVEADSREHHSREVDLIADQIRQNDIVSWGWAVLRRIIRNTLAMRVKQLRPLGSE